MEPSVPTASGQRGMVSLRDLSNVPVAMVPLYVAMLSAYLSARWLKMFTSEQCSGINKFVARFSLPLLSFQVISSSNPYAMNTKLLLADVLQKALALVGLAAVGGCRSDGCLDWMITGFSLSTLPNTLIVGIPLLRGMYGEEAAGPLVQIVVLQTILWKTLLLVLFELRAARLAIRNSQQSIIVQITEFHEEMQAQGNGNAVVTRSSVKSDPKKILKIVWWKLVNNLNTHASLLGLAWALISFRWGVRLPPVISNSISILADGGLGMAMFSLGLFMASETNIIACGARMTALAIAIRFVAGPALMAAASYAVGLRGTLLDIAIVQAALPQGIVPFVFAKEYDLHPAILSTSVFISMIMTIPIALAYYFILDL